MSYVSHNYGVCNKLLHCLFGITWFCLLSNGPHNDVNSQQIDWWVTKSKV